MWLNISLHIQNMWKNVPKLFPVAYRHKFNIYHKYFPNVITDGMNVLHSCDI